MEDKSIDGPSHEDIEFLVPFGHISAKWWGPKNKKPLIAIHGCRDSSGTFDPLIKLLPKDLSILCIDLLGHGRSSHIPQGFLNHLLWDGLIILRRIVRQHNWRCISIMGHSLGSAVGFLYAAAYAYDTETFISIDTIVPVIHDISEIVKNTGLNLDKFLSFDELECDRMSPSDTIELVKETYNGTLINNADKILMKRGKSSENDTYMFSRDPHYKESWMGLLSLDLVKALAGHITCRYMYIKAKPHKSLDNEPVYSDILEIIKTNAKEFHYKEYDGDHYIHFNNPQSIVSDIENFILHETQIKTS